MNIKPLLISVAVLVALAAGVHVLAGFDNSKGIKGGERGLAVGLQSGEEMLPRSGATVLFPSGGGTGSSTLSGILKGNGTSAVGSVKIGNNLTWDGTTLSSTGGGGSGNVSTSTAESAGQLAYWTSNSATPALLGKVATGSLTANSPLSFDQTRSVIGGAAVLSLGTVDISSNTNLAATYPITLSGDTLSFPATSSQYAGTQGQVLAFADGIIKGVATTTFSTGLTYAAGAVTCDVASGSIPGCLSAANWTTFNGKENVLTFSTPLIRTSNTISWSGLATTSQPSSSNLLVSNGGAGVYGVATTSETCTSPLSCTAHAVLTGGGAITIQAATASQAGHETQNEFNYVHTATSTFSAPLVYTGATNAVTCTTATASVPGCLAAADFTTFSGKLNFSNLFNSTPPYQALSTISTSTTLWLTGTTLSLAASSSMITSATSSSLGILNITNKLLATNASGGVVGTTTISPNLLSANTISGIVLGGTLGALSATDNTLTFSGSYDGSAARTVGVALGNSNQWTASTTFTKVVNLQNASSSLNTFGTIWLPAFTSYSMLGNDQTGKVIQIATSTAYGTGTNGQVLGYTNGVLGPVSTTSNVSLSGGTTGMLTAWGSATALNATSGPTAAWFTATSTTFASTLQAMNVLGAVAITPAVRTAHAIPAFKFTGAADTALTASTEVPEVQFNDTAIDTHANGPLALQRDFLINAPTEAMTAWASGLITDLATMGITGAPLLGNNASSTNNHTLLLGASALNASTTNSYGITVNSNTGGKNNFAAQFLGGQVVMGTSSSAWALLTLASSTGPQIALADTLGGTFAWAFRAINNNLYFATSTVTATSTIAAFSISSVGNVTIPNTLTAGTLSLTNKLSVANGGTGVITFGGTNTILYTSAADTLTSSANLTFNATGLILTATNASSTNGDFSQSLFVASKQVNPYQNATFPYGATSTAWTGTTTETSTPAPFAGTLKDVICDTATTTGDTSAAKLNVQFFINSTAVAPMVLQASTTKGSVTFTSSNTFVRGDTIWAYFGTPVSSPRKISCVVRATVTSF